MERLWNNILLADDFAERRSEADHVPYLEHPPEVIDVTVGRQLFVDDFLIESTDLSPRYHQAKKMDCNPILKPETEWEIAQSPVACPKSGGVWYDERERKFKMWYEAGWLRHLCYAESADGIRWERPDLGIVKGTNIILPYDGYEPEKYYDGLGYLRPDSTTVWIDDDAPAKERYKLFLRNPGGKSPGIVAVSGDGIRFERFALTGEIHDRSTVFYNPFRKKWVYSIRNAEKQADGVLVRKRDYRECDSLLDGAVWEPQEQHDWMRCDSADRPLEGMDFLPQLYNVDCVGYESIMLGMFQILYGPENDVSEKNGIPKITELIPMYSRDGYHFSRPCRDSLIGASRSAGAWDRGYVQSVGGVTVIHGDELWIYYIGFGGDEEYRGQLWITNGMYRNGATGIATLRRDGFVSMEGRGTLTTRKLTVRGKSDLFVNAKGRVSAELLDDEGRVLFVSQPFCGDSVTAPLRFDRAELCDLRVFRLRFSVDGALYSFGFADGSGDFGGAHAAGKL